MEKRLITAIILTIAFLLVYSKLMPPPPTVPQEEKQPPVSAPEPLASKPYEPAPHPVLPDISAEEAVIETGLYRAVLTGAGGGIKSFRLKEYSERFKPAAVIEREISGIDRRISKIISDILTIRNRSRSETNGERILELANREETLKTEQEFLNRSKEILLSLKQQTEERQRNIEALLSEIEAVKDLERESKLRERLRTEKGVELIPPSAAEARNYPPSLFLPSLNINTSSLIFKTNKDVVRLSDDNPAGEVVLEAVAEGGVQIRKIFSFRNDDYSINLRLEVENASRGRINEENPLISYYPAVGLMESVPARGVITGIVSYVDGRVATDTIGGRGARLKPGEPRVRQGAKGWIAIKGKYFAAALLPRGARCILTAEALAPDGKRISANLSGFSLERGDVFSETATLYLGPQKSEELEKADGSLKELIDFGFWSPVAKIIDFLLKAFYEFFNNYGLAIIALSLTVKVVFYPLTHKSFRAMHKMQEDMKSIQPKLNELKKKYGNNQAKLNKATMELYKKEGVNPMSGCKSGCFPMLLQMPVFFALYAVLNTSIDMRGAYFLGWITDLSLPDPLRILPIFMGISMFWQQKMTGTGGGGPQQEQAKMMQWMMPVMLTFIFFGLPAGIVLYWFSFNIFTSLQQLITKKHGA